jgi:signal transduction histidine kinase
MRERAELLGGTLRLIEPDAGGTRVRMAVPKSGLTAPSDEGDGHESAERDEGADR